MNFGEGWSAGDATWSSRTCMVRALHRVSRKVEILIPISKARRLGHDHVLRDDRVYFSHCHTHRQRSGTHNVPLCTTTYAIAGGGRPCVGCLHFTSFSVQCGCELMKFD